MKDKPDTIYDVAIVGGGSAGCSAAIYATRYSLKTLFLSGPMPGGLITEALEVENYPGFESINGLELAQKFIDQAIKLGAGYEVEVITGISKDTPETGLFLLKTASGKSFSARSVILAMGTKHKKLGIKGEEEFAGKGVSYCSTCDGPFFKGKIVAVIGGGNSAVEGAQDVAVHAKQVYIIYRSALSAAPFYIEQLRKRPNITEIAETNVLSINGGKFVTAINLDKPFNGMEVLPVDGVFVQIGYMPENQLAGEAGIGMTEYGYVKVDAGMGTNVAGIFCAGDLNNASNYFHQQVTSAAEGAIAAQSAYRYLQGIAHVVSSKV